jgi:hypothetical protein
VNTIMLRQPDQTSDSRLELHMIEHNRGNHDQLRLESKEEVCYDAVKLTMEIAPLLKVKRKGHGWLWLRSKSATLGPSRT